MVGKGGVRGFKNESGLVGYCSVFRGRSHNRVGIGSHSSSHQLDSNSAYQANSNLFFCNFLR